MTIRIITIAVGDDTPGLCRLKQKLSLGPILHEEVKLACQQNERP